LETGLAEATHELKERFGIEVDLVKLRNPERVADDHFLSLLENDRLDEAKEFITSADFRAARHRGTNSVEKTLNDAASMRRDYIENGDRITIIAFAASLAIIALLGVFAYKIIKTTANNLTTQEALRTQIKSERSEAAIRNHLAFLGEIAAGIAHEVNNPLMIFKLLIRNMEDSLAQTEGINPQVFHYLDRSKINIERIATIVDGMTRLSRRDSFSPMEYATVDRLIADALDICEPTQLECGVRIQVEKNPDHVKIYCRPMQITQILVNLLSNALDAIETLPEKWVRIGVVCENATVKFLVTDSGGGIPAGIVEKIMTPFYTTKGTDRGTGLGLSLSNQIARDHSGDVKVNTKFKNTQLVLTLPQLQLGTQI
jgi:C4-dicarboxylate-specific signal transduction histidine kinase